MATFLPLGEEGDDSSSPPLSASGIQAFERLQEMGMLPDSFEPISTTALMTRLHLKYSKRPWKATERLVDACMDKPKTGSTTTSKSPISSCLEKLHRAINAKALFAVTNELEHLSKQKRLNTYTCPNGTTFYITSEALFIEIQLKADGEAIKVKLAHLGETPQICEDLLQVLRMKNYDAFGSILDELLNVYQIPGNSKTRAKAYRALQSLEKDITSLSLLDRAPDADRVTEILCGKVGYVRPRTAGTPMNLEFYLSPMQIVEEQLTPGLQVPGVNVFVTIEESDVTYKLPFCPLIRDSWREADGYPLFLPLTEKLCIELSACFFLKFSQPFPMSSSCIQKLQKITGIPITGLIPAPLHELILYHALPEEHRDNQAMNNYFVVSLPDCPKHCYYMDYGTGGSDLTGAMVSKLPFKHPKDVPDMIEVLRQQAAYNMLVSSCVYEVTKYQVSSYLLHFEVRPVKASSFSVTFQEPGEENLSCVLIDVPSSKEVKCTFYALSQEWVLSGMDDFFTRILKRCMSVPILMRSIFKKAAELKPDEAVQGTEETSELSPQEGTESNEDTLQNAEIAWESWSPDIMESWSPGIAESYPDIMEDPITESLPESTIQDSLSDTMEENAASLELSDDRTEANSSSSTSPLVSSCEIQSLLQSLSEDILRDQAEEGTTDEPWTLLNNLEES